MASQQNSEYIRLKELGTSKYEVAKNEADVRGWIVKNGQGRILGKVNDLLFDIESEKVLYMVLDLEGNEMYLKERKVLAPLSLAEINEAYHNIIYPGVMANELTELPTYEKGKASTRIEDMVHHAFANTASASSSMPLHKLAVTPEIPKQDAQLESKYSENTQRGQRDIGNTDAQNVVGVFDHTNQGQVAIEYLLNHNFRRNQIEVSSKDPRHQTDSTDSHDHSITNWFKSVFGNDDDAKAYADAAKTGCVITVQTSSLEEAQRAAEILDKHGAISLENSGENGNSNYRSRILDSRKAGSGWKNHL